MTQALWQAVMGNSPSNFAGPNLPVEQVSWDDCQQFIEKLNQKTGAKFRLPTEAQWEFAARGGNLSKGYKFSGSDNFEEVAWCYNNSGKKTHNVGTLKANELGLYDMSGNVNEWCQDLYGPYSSEAQTDPTGPLDGSRRVIRGGGWSTGGSGNFRPSFRLYYYSSTREKTVGFRLAFSSGVPEEPEPSNAKTYTVEGISFNMVEVEGGTFQMGSDDSDANSNEKPVHSVTLSSYYIGETEVTQALWKAVMGSNPSNFVGDNFTCRASQLG